jgi:alpha-tubulin suppressor-like RCC1 family protein
LTLAGAAYCWGNNSMGQLGDSTTTGELSAVRVAGGLTFTTLAVGNWHNCALTAQGAAYCWGGNGGGQVGDGTTTNRTAPVPVLGNLTFVAISASGSHTCALTREGAAYCWGDNSRGELGDGTYTGKQSPIPVVGRPAFASIAVGDYYTCGVTVAEGRLFCWGANDGSQLGDTSLSALSFAIVSAGYEQTCAVTGEGVAYCWGANSYGERGSGHAGDSWESPEAVVGGFHFTTLTVGDNHACGTSATSGAAYCWGYNFDGQLGDGTTNDRSSPQAVLGNLTFAGMAAGNWHTCGVTTDGAAYCWGANGFGNLGTGMTGGGPNPARVVGFGP